MSTTTIRMPDELKSRIHNLARARGVSAHALILEAIAEKAEDGERRQAFADVAHERMVRIADSGKTIAWDEMRDYLKARVQGQKAAGPNARKLSA